MFTQMRNRNERAGRFLAHAVAAQTADRRVDSVALDSTAVTGTALASTAMASTAMASTVTFAWNVKPCVHPTAICTHGKPYARRLQEILT